LQLTSAAAFAVATFAVVLCAGPIDEADFPEVYAKAECAKMKKCDRADWEERFTDQKDCIAEVSEFAEDVVDLVTIFCDYDGDIARTSINELKGQNCEEWNDGSDVEVCE
jgi:hypothetical protein